MPHGTEQHLEHAEHAQHAAHDPFDRRVAVSMAIIAACLAAVAMLSHRGHTETLRLQSEANIFHTQANIYHTKASDMWAFYQAKNIRSHEYQSNLKFAEFLAVKPDSEKAQKGAKDFWSKYVTRYEGPGGKGGELEQIKAKAEGLVLQGEESTSQAKAKQQESEHIHHSINWVDYGHLGLELALVLCSVSLLTKSKAFWLSGLAAAVIGVVLALTGVSQMYFTHHEEHGAAHGSGEAHPSGTPQGHGTGQSPGDSTPKGHGTEKLHGENTGKAHH